MPSKIRPPRKPPGEAAKTTIALQDKQIKMLIDRCAILEKERDGARMDARTEASAARYFQKESLERERVCIRQNGWADCAREIIDRLSK